MDNHYETLGLKTSASQEEIRRAYRILARRYHPDVNPGEASEDRFKKIAAAHAILGDPKKKSIYDGELERDQRQQSARGFQSYQRAQQRDYAARRRTQAEQQRTRSASARPNLRPPERKQPRKTKLFEGIFDSVRESLNGLVRPNLKETREVYKESAPQESSRKPFIVPRQISVIEVSVNIRDAIKGVKRSVEVAEPEGARKISVSIPPGVRNGSVIRMKGKSSSEELVLIVRLATHPFLSIQTRGLVAEIPITVGEAISGASITVPTLDEPTVIKIPPGSQSGSEIRLQEKGLYLRDGTRGDLFIRLMVHVPTSPEAVGIKEVATAFDPYYGEAVRASLPKTLVEMG